jgi:hypothetical protein
MRGEQKKKIREIKFENYRRCKFGPHYLLAQQASLRHFIGAAQVYPSLFFSRFLEPSLPRFAYSAGHSLLILLYWGGNGNT